MELVPGQYDAGGVAWASGQGAASKDSVGVYAGAKTAVIESTRACTDCIPPRVIPPSTLFPTGRALRQVGP